MTFNKNSNQQNYFLIHVRLVKYEKALFNIICFDLWQELFRKAKWPHFLVLTSLVFLLLK